METLRLVLLFLHILGFAALIASPFVTASSAFTNDSGNCALPWIVMVCLVPRLSISDCAQACSSAPLMRPWRRAGSRSSFSATGAARR